MKKCIITDKAPKAIGPYSQAVVSSSSKLVYTAGQIPIDPVSGAIVKGDIKSQTRQVLENLKAILKAANSDLSKVVKTTVFLNNMDHFSAMNEVYTEYFLVDPPSRSAVEVARLPKDVLVEIEAVAFVSE